MTVLHLASPSEVRAAVDAVHEDIRIPHPSEKFPKGEIVVPWRIITTVDRLALLGGFRISEIVTKRNKDEGNTSDTLSLEETEHKATGEKVLLIKVYALKKKNPVQREIGLPLDQRHEPWSSMVKYQWDKAGGNPCNISRQTAWVANRVIFKGLGYKIWNREDPKPGSNHFLRHIRAQELRELQLSPEERVSFFKWSARGVGLNPMLFTYSQPEWFEYFPKLLKR